MGSDEVNHPHWSVTFGHAMGGPDRLYRIPAPTRDMAIFTATTVLANEVPAQAMDQLRYDWYLESVVMADAHCCSCNSAGQCNLCGQDHHGSNCADGNHTESCMRVYDYHATVIQKATRDEEQAIMEAQDARKASPEATFVIRSASGQFWKGAGWSAEYPDAVTYPSVLAAKKTVLRLRRSHVVTIIGNYGLDSQMEVNV